MSSSLSKRLLGRRVLQQSTGRHFSSTNRVLADHVRIIEVGPRDGLQNEKTSIPVETKIELVKRLAVTGLTTIEAGSFVAPKWVPQVRLSIFVYLSMILNNLYRVDGSIRPSIIIHPQQSAAFSCTHNLPMAATECKGPWQLLQGDEHLVFSTRRLPNSSTFPKE